MFPEYIPVYDHEFSFDSGISISFGNGTRIDFYDEDDERLLSLDPADLSIICAAHRAMVREILEERVWSGGVGDEEHSF